jgi:threonine dehydrogenase-like Zn-dependent dehydrogenase
MRALTYLAPGQRALQEKPRPLIQAATDAIVRVTSTTICGTDLHILKGDVPTVTAGRTLGREGVGVIEEVGASVSNFKVGAHVLISCITSCGRCTNCKKGMYSHCQNGGGWILGNTTDGTQAEYGHFDNGAYHDAVTEQLKTLPADQFHDAAKNAIAQAPPEERQDLLSGLLGALGGGSNLGG